MFEFKQILYSVGVLIIIISVLAGVYFIYEKIISAPTSTTSTTSTLPPSTWIINAEPICANGISPKGKTRIFFAVWPESPLSSQLTWQHDEYASGVHTKQIAATAEQGSTDTQGIYIGLETERGEKIPPVRIPPHTNIIYASYFNPPTLMAHWFWNELPSGVYNIKFQLSDSHCANFLSL